MLRALLPLLLLLALPVAARGQHKTDFCRGFEEGWKAVKGDLSIVPLCPIAPLTPIGSTPWREGLKTGVEAGRRAGGGSTGATSGARDRGFCDGFTEGWKAVKGDLSIVPICPIAPITPIGSTPFREGLKAGMARARQ